MAVRFLNGIPCTETLEPPPEPTLYVTTLQVTRYVGRHVPSLISSIQSVVGRPPSISTQVQIRHRPYHGIGDMGLHSCKPSGCSLSFELLSGGGDVFMRVIYIPMHILVHIPFIFILCLCRSAANHHLGILTFNDLLHQTINKATQVNLILYNFYFSVCGLVKDFN